MRFRCKGRSLAFAGACAVWIIAAGMFAAGCGSDSGGGPTITVRPKPPASACSGQGLIGIDPVNNVAYAPIYTLDGSGNAQLAVVDLTAGTVTKELSLEGSDHPVALAYDSTNKTMLAEAADSADGDVTVYVIDTTTQAVTNSVAATGLDESETGGGILFDFKRNRAIVAGSFEMGILDTSTNPPTWDAGSVVETGFTDSLSLNAATGILFISADGENSVTDTTKSPLTPQTFDSSFGVTDGNAFDVTTNIMVLSQEVGADQSWGFNFHTLNTGAVPATADNVLVPGLGEEAPVGEGPGGQTVINCTTHQAVVADEFGQNIKLLHLPTKQVSGALDNNGQPGSMTTAGPASVFTIAGALIPEGLVGDVMTQLGLVGDPNSATIDPAHNLFYALADTDTNFHTWTPGSELPLFLVKIDLSAPVLGACPVCATHWTPTESALALP